MSVLVTGVGAVTAFGVGMQAWLAGMAEGRSAIREDPRMRELGMRCTRSGRVGAIRADFEADDTIGAREKKLFCRFSRMGWLAAMEALGGRARSGRGGVIVGSAVGPITEIDAQLHAARNGERLPSPGYAVPRVTPSLLPSLLAHRTGATCGGGTVSLACNSGLLALAHAFDAVQRGDADWYLVGGVEDDHPHIWRSFDQMRALARSGGEPMSDRCFGFVPAGGAAFVLIESAKSADRGGAQSFTELRAVRHVVCGPVMPTFNPASYTAVARDTLEQAGVSPSSVDVWMPHANGSPTDHQERDALAHQLPRAEMVLPKAGIGHTLGASGLLDVALMARQLRGAPVGTSGLKTSHAWGGSYAAAAMARV